MNSTKLSGWRLTAARVVWVVTYTSAVLLTVYGLILGRDRPYRLSPPELIERIHEMNLSFDFLVVVGLILPFFAFALTALVIFIKRSDDWMAMFFGLTMVGIGCYNTRALVVVEVVGLDALYIPAKLIHWMTVMFAPMFLFIFPDGRFRPGWTKVLFALQIPFLIVFPDLGEVLLQMPIATQYIDAWRWQSIVGIAGAYLSLGIVAQLVRYRRYSDSAQRQQTKLVILSYCGFMASIVASYTLLLAGFPDEWFAWALVVALPMIILSPVAIGVAILRYRLYDLGIVLNRTIVYGALTVFLAICYFSLVAILQTVMPFVGENDLAVAASTLAVAALFQPARRRIQKGIDHLFYRDKYDAQKVVDRFSQRLHAEIDLESLEEELVGVIKETVHPTEVAVWLVGANGAAPATKQTERHGAGP
jgi:hypothetical protein